VLLVLCSVRVGFDSHLSRTDRGRIQAPDVDADSTRHGTRCGLGSDSVSALQDSIAPSRVRLICTVDIPWLHGVRLLITPPTISHRRYWRIHSVSFHGLTQLTDNHIRSISLGWHFRCIHKILHFLSFGSFPLLITPI